MRQHKRGKILLERAFKIVVEDPKTLFYLGLCLEFCNDEARAYEVYRNYSKISRRSPFRRLMEARHVCLTQRVMRQQARALLMQERQLETGVLDPKTIAVCPFHYQGQNKVSARRLDYWNSKPHTQSSILGYGKCPSCSST